ncbi:uncharacterized protein LOC109723762 isoform X2 [Ananas comosus]|uniref:Uncharacterized protein LOC109723762 isoform X2 n=1 Tax=Ananas comosus TaxID=4615 RepID=A0A6P5GGP4_ANACO|nr:uncharacterized protein LOC109723762 isoform X2 [Ananas comosus]
MTSSTNQFPQLDVKLSGSNYREWSVSVKLLLDALDLTDHINDTSPPADEKKLKEWNNADRRTRGIISTSVEIDIRMQLVSFTTAQQMWAHLQKLYEQSSHAQSYAEFQEITSAHQGERSIQEFYSFMQARWRQLSIMDESLCQTCLACTCATKQTQIRDQQRLFQFIMRLRPEFEALRGQLLHRSPLPTIDAALAELIAEETRLRVLHSSSPSTPTVLAAPNQVPPEPLSSTNSFVPRKNKRNIQCKYCQLWGHHIQDCRKKKWADQQRHSPRGYPAAASTLQIEHPFNTSSNNSNLNNSTPKEPESSPQTSSAPPGFGSLSTPSFGGTTNIPPSCYHS